MRNYAEIALIKLIKLESRIPIIVLLYFQSFPLNSCVHLFDRLSRENWITLGSQDIYSISFSSDLFRRFCFIMFFVSCLDIFYDLFDQINLYLETLILFIKYNGGASI